MKIGILGAGISGLSLAQIIKEHFDVELLEKEQNCGGIARTKTVEGITYHPVGGHCFNSKFTEVLDFVFEKILPRDQWHHIERNAVIKFKGEEVAYPIEYAIKQIYEFDQELALNISKDFLNSEDDNTYENLEDWFRKKFGNTLADTYFIPYNTKIWNREPKEMSPAWVEGKLPVPDKKSFFQGLIHNESDKMPHSRFYYPTTNNQNTFIDALARDLNITLNYTIDKIDFDEVSKKWVINDEKFYDILVSTLPLNVIPKLIKNTPFEILEEANKLKYNKVSTMLWNTRNTDRTWTYIPESGNFFHRYIHIGNFFRDKVNYTITEVIGEKSYSEMLKNGEKDKFLIEPIAHNTSEHAYVVFDENYEVSTSSIKNYLVNRGIYTLGRFGEWQYYNMDVCIKKSMELAEVLRKNYI